MNKSAVAIAMATAVTASVVAQAETTLYGSVRQAIRYQNFDDADIGPGGRNIKIDDDGWNINNHSSRIGLIGSEDLGGGLRAIYQLEFLVDPQGRDDDQTIGGNREKFVGLEGGFGRFSLGTHQTPYYNVVGVTDIFNASFWNLTQGVVRGEDSVFYRTPEFASLPGLRFEGLATANGGSKENHGADHWNLAAIYDSGPFFLGASYLRGRYNSLRTDAAINEINPRDADDNWQWGIGGGYSTGPFAISAMYEAGKFVGNDSIGANFRGFDQYSISGAASYVFGNNTLRIGGGYVNRDDEDLDELDIAGISDSRLRALARADDDDNWEVAVGLQHDLSNRTRVWLEYQHINDILKNGVSIGLRHDF